VVSKKRGNDGKKGFDEDVSKKSEKGYVEE
jgi:hypothetical protein